ncbi:MAG TPA: beta-ketoacyl synthase N-terminal-like domain-containing protein, partial [Pyrinomonadaceae bacterium]|nr:beta-ketoacyl synthase N-terminal-like domain-containing protein [Pyrinomonadaceae bacterium]
MIPGVNETTFVATNGEERLTLISEESFDNSASCDVAIIGLAGRFPGARNVEEFWNNLKDGVEGISFFSDDEIVGPQDIPNLVKAKGTLSDVELFDAPFFDIPTREAQLMDPQQRLFLEAAWTALEDSGYDVSSYAGQIAVYAGVSTNTYLLTRMAQLSMGSPADHYSMILANEKDYLATRVSYKLNLRGESITVQTSCSTSLVAVHLACQSLLSGQSDMALAGGVSIGFPQKTGYFYQEGMILSPDGHCRPFDQKAKGIVPGFGLGVVVLKLLSEAIKDGDNVRAVIKGSAINNDGHLKMGYTAPSLEGQTDVIVRALAMAEVEPESVTYVEAHGTGTPIGDPIEVEALTRAFRRQTQKKAFCALGAVKSNIGHLDSAAGIAGLIKTVLSLEHKQIPPTLHFEKPNPMIDFENSPFKVNPMLVDWQRNGFPRRAGVSSFGIGGTNAHVIVEEAPATATSASPRESQLLTFSTKTASALPAMAESLAQYLEQQSDNDLADVAYTLNVGRQAFAHRRFIVARDREEAVAALRRDEMLVRISAQEPRVVFMFPGQGSLSVGMARAIYEREGEFRKQFDECSTWLRQRYDLDLLRSVYPNDAQSLARAEELLAQPQFALPALFTIEYALAKLWMSWGVTPRAMIGHSFGEYVAACLAGVFTLTDALSLVVVRGRLMQQLPPGAMSAVRLGAAEVERYLEGDVSISAVNSPNICTVTGPLDQIEKLEQVLSDNRVASQRLDVPYAYHSSMVDAILPEFESAVSKIKLQAPSIPYISNLTGTWIKPEEVVTAGYWTRQMRHAVRFAPGVETLTGSGHSAFVEIGTGQTLSPLLKSYVKRGSDQFVVASLSHSPSVSDEVAMFKALGQLWKAGVRIDWRGFYRAEKRRRLSLPTYPFERKRYWIEAPRREEVSPAVSNSVAVNDPVEAAVVPAQQNGHSSASFNEIQAAVAGIWGDVLGHTSINLDDSFFDLGGDSLLATQVHARLKQAFPVSISLQQLFEHQTLRQVSELIEQSIQSETNTTEAYLPVQRVERNGHLPLSFAQEWLWLVDQLQPGSAAYNLPAAVRLEGPLNVAALHKSFNEIVRRHEILRTKFQVIDGQPVQVIAAADSLSFPITDLEEIPAPERETRAQDLIAREVSKPFDLSEAPMIRTRLLRLGEQDHIALCTVHHIAFDAWSGG